MEKSVPAQQDRNTINNEDRREHRRIPGPFDGVRLGFLETPLQIYDLSAGGCFINSLHEQQQGVTISLKIDIPDEGWFNFTAETLYRRPGYGYAVRFVDMNPTTRKRLERALERLGDSRGR